MRSPPPIPSADSFRVYSDTWLYSQPMGQWFPDPRPLDIDLGCGKGRFLLAQAAAHPERNFLGIERQLRRVRKIDRKLVRGELRNVRLLRVEGDYAMRHLIPEASVNTCYIFFPDPWPKARQQMHRIFNPEFITALYRTLEPGGCVHFATDHLSYFYEVLDLLLPDKRFQEIEPYIPDADHRTDFERLFRTSKPIGRYSFRRI